MSGGTGPADRPASAGTGQRSTMQASEGQSMSKEMQERAGQAAAAIQDRAEDVVEKAGEQTKSMLDSQKSRAAGGLHGVAEVLHRTASEMEKGDQANVASYAHSAADRIDRWSSTLEDRSVDDLLSDAERYARRQPEIVIGGAFVLGFLASRFLKSSSARRESRRMPARYTASTEGLGGYYVAGNWPRAGSSGMQGGMRPDTSMGRSSGMGSSSSGMPSDARPGTSSGAFGPGGEPSSGTSGTQPERTP
jgi:hypothetical protein